MRKISKVDGQPTSKLDPLNTLLLQYEHTLKLRNRYGRKPLGDGGVDDDVLFGALCHACEGQAASISRIPASDLEGLACKAKLLLGRHHDNGQHRYESGVEYVNYSLLASMVADLERLLERGRASQRAS